MDRRPKKVEGRSQEPVEQGVVPIQSVQRAAAMLSLFSAKQTTLTLAEMRDELGMNTPTAHRYAITLRQTGLLHYDAATRSYSLGPRIILLGTVGLNGLTLTQIARTYLDSLVRRTNLTATLAIWDGKAPVVVQVNDETDGLLSIGVRIGTRLPPLGSAAGKVFLAFSDEAAASYGLAGQDGATQAVAQDVLTMSQDERESFITEIDKIRQTHIGINLDTMPGFCSIAAPVLRAGEIMGALVLNGSSASLPATERSVAAGHLLQTARALGRALEGGESLSSEP
ncbi:IclR family transcriptional regulator [Pseudochelatococcus sp. B33]